MLYVKKITLRPCKGQGGPRSGQSSHRPRVYIWPEGETVLENLVHGRHSRPYTVYRTEVLPQLWRLLGWTAPVKVGWSQRAGCSCPCSPGFIVQSRDIPYDVHVTVTDKYVSEVEIQGTLR